MSCTIHAAKTKALISFTVTAKLICIFVFAYAKSRFSPYEAYLILHLKMCLFTLIYRTCNFLRSNLRFEKSRACLWEENFSLWGTFGIQRRDMDKSLNSTLLSYPGQSPRTVYMDIIKLKIPVIPQKKR